MKETVILACVPYFVTIQDGQIMFHNDCGFFWMQGAPYSFAFSRDPDPIAGAAGTWDFHPGNTDSPIAASHILRALAYCEDQFGKSFEPYKRNLHPNLVP
ncbi:MAG: hypothetical protein JWO82_3766 [Akkermansiaceae bacterium]|nr:hypothetical protein [Akkermansiaceae bacterium]